MPNTERFRSLQQYVDAIGVRKWWLAKQIGVSRFQMTALLHPGRYAVAISDDTIERIAALLNQSTEYVKRLYSKAA